MTSLRRVFEHLLPAALRQSTGASVDTCLIGFRAEGPPESGYWVLSLPEKSCRQGTDEDVPDLLVEAPAGVMVLLFSNALDIQTALDRGALRLYGDRSPLSQLARLLAAEQG